MSSLNLSALPSDIVFTVLRNTDFNTIEDSRLISPRWNSIALEYLSNPKNRPTIKYLQWDIDGQLTLHVNESCLRFLGIENWQCYPLPSTRNVFYAKSISLLMLIRAGKQLTAHRIDRLFQRFKKIERLEFFIDVFDSHEERVLFQRAINDLPIGELLIEGNRSLDNNSRSHLVDLLRNRHHSVNSLIFQAHIFHYRHDTISDIGSFLISVSNLVAVVKIQQSRFQIADMLSYLLLVQHLDKLKMLSMSVQLLSGNDPSSPLSCTIRPANE